MFKKTLHIKTKHTPTNLVENPKDKTESFDKSEIYELNYKNYHENYNGQSPRAIETRYGEHMIHIKYGSIEKLYVAHHVLYFGYSGDKSLLNVDGFTLVKTQKFLKGVI